MGAEIKNYYNDITHNNLDLIKTLKEDVAEMKKREAQVRWGGRGLWPGLGAGRMPWVQRKE